MTTIPVVVPTSYEVVFWPDGCSEVPTYDQLMDTLELVYLVLDMKNRDEDIPEDLNVVVTSWLLFNDIGKFEKAAADAIKHQQKLSRCVEENRVFPFPLNKYKMDN